MEEQRLQAYYQLIQTLLSCFSNEEVTEVLAADTELVDAGFVQVLTVVANDFAQQGKENTANWLRNLATQITLETSPITSQDTEVYGQFLQQVLIATAESNGDPQVIYPILAANTNKLNHIFAELLRRCSLNELAEVEPDTATSMAAVIRKLSDLIQQFPFGSKANNMEIAIAGYEIALTVYTRTAFPEDWAMTQNNLGSAYVYRILGKRAENLENAIAFYNAALEVYTRTAFPQGWATIQNNLGLAYLYRILGERAENIENAIAFYNAALEVRTRTAFPQDWAMTQNNLGLAYSYRILRERAENLEKAITFYNAALEVYTRTAFPKDWAMTQNNLASAYRNRILGERAENLENAIAFYSATLEVRTRTAFPQDWAATQNNLGNAYSERILGERAENVEKAIAFYNAALEVYTRTTLPQDWAGTQNNLALAYSNRILGERAENVEKAIAFYNAALEVYTRTAFPEDWAMTQNNLGLAYYERILGERAENVEKAIAFYNAALEVYTRTAFPEDWAMTQNNLGSAYVYRILGKRAENLENAIAFYNAALEVRTRKAFPEDWATTQNNLGLAYYERILGESAGNLEKAITAYNAALEVYTRTAFPQDWAMTQNHLGLAYDERILGEEAENVEKAIVFYNAALEVYTRTAFPQDWAATQHNLAHAYRKRILGKRAENLEKAITGYNAALEVRTRTAFPQDWARTQDNLAGAYHLYGHIIGESAENLEKAIAAYNAALEVRTRTAFPQDWAITQNNLASAYSNRILGERADNLENAIAFYNAALEVITRTAFPQDWAMTQNNLGLAYSYRILGERAENVEKAIAFYNAALEIRTRTAFPQDYAVILLHLGTSYQNTKQFDSAYKSFTDAIATVESLRGETISGDESKRKQAEKWNELYIRMVEVCLELGNITAAIEYVERSKTRNLVELILERDSKTIFPPEVVAQLEKLRDEIASGQYQLQNGKAENPTALAEHLQQLRQQRQALQDNYLPVGSGFKFDQFQETLDDSTAIIEWYITREKIIVFVLKPNGQELTVWQSQPEDRKALFDWRDNYLQNYYTQTDQWQNQLEEQLQQLAKILHIEELLVNLTQDFDRLILVPHRFLHLFPLHALPVGESYLIDLFPNGVGYAPSSQLLQQVQLRERSNFQSLFAIQNPTEDLYEKDLGAVAAIKKQFVNDYTLKQAEAKKSAIISSDENPQNVALNKELLQANCAFFFCHGYFNRNSPLDSGLLFADCFVSSELVKVDSKRYITLPEDEHKAVDLTKCLILADIITHVKLEHCRLVTLSACETGVIDSENTSDEYIGLPSGFLLAGSTNVVSSLWTVDATATALLMIKFYEELQQQSNIIVALNTAQRWLRNTSVKDFRTWFRESNLDEDWQDELDEQFDKIEQEQGNTTKIFASPFYWSAFCAIGKGY